jgi:hypothetical protein
MSQETVYSILFTLLQRHEDAAKYYKKLHGSLSRPGLSEWIDDLIKYRESMAGTIRSFLENTAPIPVRNKSREDTTSILHQKWDEVKEALSRENWLEVVRVCRQTEESLSSYYQTSLGSEGIAEGIRDLLQQQHKKILEVNRKAERLETVPQLCPTRTKDWTTFEILWEGVRARG